MQHNQIVITWLVNPSTAAFFDGTRSDHARCKVMTLRGRIAGSSGPRRRATRGLSAVHRFMPCWSKTNRPNRLQQVLVLRRRSPPGLIIDDMVSLGSRQAWRRRPQGTSVPMRRRAAPCRDRAHGRPREDEADACPQGQQGTAGARAPEDRGRDAADDGRLTPQPGAAAGASAMPARHKVPMRRRAAQHRAMGQCSGDRRRNDAALTAI